MKIAAHRQPPRRQAAYRQRLDPPVRADANARIDIDLRRYEQRRLTRHTRCRGDGIHLRDRKGAGDLRFGAVAQHDEQVLRAGALQGSLKPRLDSQHYEHEQGHGQGAQGQRDHFIGLMQSAAQHQPQGVAK